MYNIALANTLRNLCSFDTVCLTLTYPPNKKINRRVVNRQHGGFYIAYRRNKGWQIVSVTFTFGGLLYGSNVFSIDSQDEIDRALEIISCEVSALLNVEFDAVRAGVTLLDAFRDSSVPEKKPYLDTLTKQEVSRLHRRNYGVSSYYSGFTWHSQNRRIRIYDKFLQLCAEHAGQPKYIRDFARTLIRFEPHLTKKPLKAEVKAFYGSDKDLTAGKILKLEFAEHIVNKHLKLLELDKPIPTTAAHESLILANFPKAKTANTLIRFISDIKTVGEARLKKAGKNKFNYRKSQLKKLGIWKTLFADNRLESFTDFPNDAEPPI